MSVTGAALAYVFDQSTYTYVQTKCTTITNDYSCAGYSK